MKSILCAGEALCDFISTSVGAGLAGSTLFEKRAGGSPFNTAVGIARLGLPVALLAKVGTDEFGTALHNLMLAENLDPRFIVVGEGNNTTLAMAGLSKTGEPEFRFYRDNAADVSLTMQEVPAISPEEISLFHFGSISLVEEPAASTYVKIFRLLKKEGVLTSLDPNIRPLYANGKESYLKLIRSLLNKVDILKMSRDDLKWLTGKDTVEDGIPELP
ncbi:MAG: carbohydrate kinase, partial [Synergistaceae bacterium]|nr:carbohydrate kinase [Synergistaceae bacterium]